MNRMIWILVLAASVALAQSNTHSTPAKGRPTSVAGAKPGGTVALNEPVITIRGVCAESAQETKASHTGLCRTVITRREFESFLKSLSATAREVEPSDYRRAAENYFILMVYANAGQRAGVQKDPRFEQLLEATRRRALSDMYRVQNMEKALRIPDAEIAAYYEKNIDDFEEVDLDRFQLPMNNPFNLSDVEFRAKAKQLAEELHARAVKGEDISKLEKEGLEALGQKALPRIEICGCFTGEPAGRLCRCKRRRARSGERCFARKPKVSRKRCTTQCT
jgi:hypothetical protein